MTIEKRVNEDFRKLIQGKQRATLCYILNELNGENYYEDIYELVKEEEQELENTTLMYIADYVRAYLDGDFERWDILPKDKEQEYLDIIHDMGIKIADGELIIKI